MKAKFTKIASALALVLTVAPAAPAFAQSDVVTVYSNDGLHDGTPSWFGTEFDAFTHATGIKVQYVEAGSGGIVERVAKEKANTQADVLVTLPPFMQRAAADGLLQPYMPKAGAQIDTKLKDQKGNFIAIVNNYPNFIYNSAELKQPPATFDDLLTSQFKQKIQYSTPGQAGDGTAVMLQAFHAFGSKQAGFDYLKKLEANNLGPSASTGKLTALVNKGELYVANGDVQMNLAQMGDNANIRIFFPAAPDGNKYTFAFPYYIGLVASAPHSTNGKKLIDFLLSKAAQEQVSPLARGVPVRNDVQPNDPSFKTLQATLKGVKIWAPDWDQVLRDLPQDVASYKSIVTND